MQLKERQDFPISAGIALGLGLGGFFDRIVLHQLLQWHHMLTSAGYPADTLRNLQINTLWDGIFHASTYVFVVVGLIKSASAAHPMVKQTVDRQPRARFRYFQYG